MNTHDYTDRYWGHDFMIKRIKNGGNNLSMMGWGRGIKPGDFIILPDDDYGRSTRYQVITVEYFRDQKDMWKMDACFAPRQEPQSKTQFITNQNQ